MAYQAQLFSELNVGEQFALVTNPGDGGQKIATIDNIFRFKISSTQYVSVQPSHSEQNGVYLSSINSEGKLTPITVSGDPEVMRIAKLV